MLNLLVMRIVIIEDDKISAQRLMKIITMHRPMNNVVAILNTLKEVEDFFADDVDIDLIFSDIRLLDGLVFDVFDKFTLKCKVVFTTAFSEYTIKAFKYNGIGYLLKPFSEEDVLKELDICKNKIEENLSELSKITRISVDKEIRKRFMVPFRDGYEIIKVENICFICCENRQVIIADNCGRKISLDISFDECIRQMDSQEFFRVNRQYLININYISKLINYWGRKIRVILEHYDDLEIIIPRERISSFKAWINR